MRSSILSRIDNENNYFQADNHPNREQTVNSFDRPEYNWAS